MRIIILSSSLFTDRILLYSSFSESILQGAVAEVWSTSYPENKSEWENKGYTIKAFPLVANFREKHNVLRSVNNNLWAHKLKATSILSLQRFADNRSDWFNFIKSKSERFAGYSLSKLGSGLSLEKRLVNFLGKQSRSPEAYQLLKKNLPDGLVVTNPFWMHESAIAIEAAKLGIPIFSFIPSWDNITTKSRLVFKSKAFGVWSSLRTAELRKYYPIFKDAVVFETGAPQYDIFFNGFHEEAKNSFFERNLLNPNLPLIVYALGSPNFLKCEIETSFDTLNYFKKQGLLDKCQVLVRPHPNKHNSERESEYTAIHNNIKVQHVGLSGLLTEKRTQSAGQINDWISTFKYCDIVINLSSTVLLDAMYFDKPVINIDFDGGRKKKYQSFIKFINRKWIHLSTVFNSGALDYAASVEEIYQAVMKNLSDPKSKTIQRTETRKLICNNEDGLAGKKLAEAILITFNKDQNKKKLAHQLNN